MPFEGVGFLLIVKIDGDFELPWAGNGSGFTFARVVLGEARSHVVANADIVAVRGFLAS